MAQKLVVASDHAGYELKEHLKKTLTRLGIPFEDLGTHSTDSVDYPDYARKVAQAVSTGRAERGLLVCGSGQGMAMTANRYPHVRAALAADEETARLSREHNDANVLALGGRLTLPETAERILEVWLTTPFAGGRHAGRVAKIERPEAASRGAGLRSRGCASRTGKGAGRTEKKKRRLGTTGRRG